MASPVLIYYWGLSNLKSNPVASDITLSSIEEAKIWEKEFGLGKPRVKEINPYQYIGYLYCSYKNEPNSIKCKTSYPGFSLAAFSVREQVREQVQGKGNTVWQFTWASYSVWATKNWNIHQLLATYSETYDR